MIDDAGSDSAVYADTDEDGVCDQSEANYNTNPTDPDSDDDGYPDGLELRAGYNPLLPADPPRDTVVELQQSATATAEVVVRTEVMSAGEDFAGAFEPLYVPDLIGLRADAFYRGSLAVGADPASSVETVIAEQERFVGVDGDATLVFQIDFLYGDHPAQACKGAYPFLYRVKGRTSEITYSARYLLVTLPPDQAFDRALWCLGTRGCF